MYSDQIQNSFQRYISLGYAFALRSVEQFEQYSDCCFEDLRGSDLKLWISLLASMVVLIYEAAGPIEDGEGEAALLPFLK